MACSPETVAECVRLLDSGLSAGEVARRQNVTLSSVRNWKRGRVPKPAARLLAGMRNCRRCGEAEHDFRRLPADSYAYLLGAYLGDGCLHIGHGHTRLQIVLDTAHPWIIISINDAIEDVRGRLAHVAPPRDGQACVTLVSYWKQWPCLFPQHGPGKKHLRPIVLAPWQEEIVSRAPEAFLRGLIHSDGWRGLNRVRSKGKDYAYPRYQFSSRSDDIRSLFASTCDQIGVGLATLGAAGT